MSIPSLKQKQIHSDASIFKRSSVSWALDTNRQNFLLGGAILPFEENGVKPPRQGQLYLASFSFDYKILLAERGLGSWGKSGGSAEGRVCCSKTIAFIRSRLILQMHKKDRDCRVRWAMDCRTSKENSHEMENVPWKNHFGSAHYKLCWLSIVHHCRFMGDENFFFFPISHCSRKLPNKKWVGHFFLSFGNWKFMAIFCCLMQPTLSVERMEEPTIVISKFLSLTHAQQFCREPLARFWCIPVDFFWEWKECKEGNMIMPHGRLVQSHCRPLYWKTFQFCTCWTSLISPYTQNKSVVKLLFLVLHRTVLK